MYLLPDHTAGSVTKAICKVLEKLKDQIRTLTFNNGKEFSYHEVTAGKLDTKVYSANPNSYWQRAINKNTNGLIRCYNLVIYEIIEF